MASSDPITWQLILVVQARLQEITVANGYRTDIGNNVLVEDTQANASTALPVVVVDVNKSALTRAQGAPRTQRTCDFTVEASMKASIANAKQLAHQVVADIEKALNITSQSTPTGLRFAIATDTEILKRPDGLDAFVVRVTGTANYMP